MEAEPASETSFFSEKFYTMDRVQKERKKKKKETMSMSHPPPSKPYSVEYLFRHVKANHRKTNQ